MPQVPYTGTTQVAPNLRPASPLNIRTPPGAFGADMAQAVGQIAQGQGQIAQAQAGAGRALSAVGDELMTRAIALQQLDEQAAATNAYADLSDRIGARLEQFRSLEGRAAKDDYPNFVKDINGMREEVGAGLSSDYAKQVYHQESRRLQSQTVVSAGAHAGDQFKHYLIGTEQSSINNSINDAVLHPEDESAFKLSLEKIKASSGMMKSFKGWSDEQAKDYENTQTSKAVFERATTLARTKPQAAQKVLDDAVKAGQISGEEAGKAGTFIRNQRNQVMTRVESASLLSGNGLYFGTGKVPIGRAREAIGMIESGGDYNPPHPTVTKGKYAGQHALGKYGVMQGNLQPWLKEAGLPAMSEAEFLRDHDAQDKLFEFKFGQFMEEHGSANKAAAVWFTGSPTPDPKANDGHTTAPAYLQKFNANLARTASSGDLDLISQRRADELAPDDSEFKFGFRDRVIAEHSHERQIERENEFTRRQIIDQAILPAPDGKLPTSIDDIKDPAVHAAWDQLNATDRLRYQKQFAQNAKGDYAPTEANQQAYHEWLGRLIDPQASEEDRTKALNADYATMPLPANQRQQLINLRAKVFAQSQKNPAVNHAMQVLSPMLNEAGITKKTPDDYFQFLGTLHMVMEQKMADTGKPLKDDEIKTIGAGLLRKQAVGGWWSRLMGTDPEFKAEVPEGERAKIVKAYSDEKGFEPTDLIIQQIYAAHQYNQFYSSQKAEKKFGGAIGVGAGR